MNNQANDLSLRVTALTMATEILNATKEQERDYNATDLAQWIYDWLKDGEEIDNPKKTSLSVVN